MGYVRKLYIVGRQKPSQFSYITPDLSQINERIGHLASRDDEKPECVRLVFNKVRKEFFKLFVE